MWQHSIFEPRQLGDGAAVVAGDATKIFGWENNK
jgi:hypothetical protein